MENSLPWYRWLFLLQGIYYAATALWPIVHMRSFLLVTGPKTDLWLVRTVGWMIFVISLPLLLFALLPRLEALPYLILLSAGASVALACIDTYYTARGVISPIYLADGVVEVGILALIIILALF